MRTVVLVSLLTLSSAAFAADNPVTTHNKFTWSVLKKMVLTSAEKMPEAQYGFKPVETVRSFGQVVGHIADSQYTFCSVVLGEKNPSPKVEKTKTSKADLIAGLKDAFAYCDRAYEGMTDVSGAETVPFHGAPTPKESVMTVNQMHTTEHYGNLVTYLRMNAVVPPTSDPEFLKSLSK